MCCATKNVCAPSPPASRTEPACVRDLAIGGERARDKGLFQPGRAALVEHRQHLARAFHVVHPDRARVDQQDALLAQPLARGAHVVLVLLHRALAKGPPAKLGRAIALGRGCRAP